MSGLMEVSRIQQRLDAVFARAAKVSDDELSADFARYLCVLVSGFTEKAIAEILIEYTRRSSHPRVQAFVEGQLERVTNLKGEKIVQLLRAFDDDWGASSNAFIVDETKDAIDSVVNLRNQIAHGKSVGVTFIRIRNYYDRIKDVVQRTGRLCLP